MLHEHRIEKYRDKCRDQSFNFARSFEGYITGSFLSLSWFIIYLMKGESGISFLMFLVSLILVFMSMLLHFISMYLSVKAFDHSAEYEAGEVYQNKWDDIVDWIKPMSYTFMGCSVVMFLGSLMSTWS
jgi:hypothetical protein